MDPVSNKEWKQNVGFTINYDSEQSSGDDFDIGDVVMRRGRAGRSASRLLEDRGDGAAADLLGTTPPRSRIRDKEKRRNIIESETTLRKVFKDNRRNTVADFYEPGEEPETPERRKRSSLKASRARERDWKLEMGNKEYRSDSLPSPTPPPALPTLVESCSRFMSLSSRLKRSASPPAAVDAARALHEPPAAGAGSGAAPQSRVDFHRTFSLLINMGNGDRGCRRTISREEQVWQNELKDLIWLELQARLAGRPLAEHDAWLCAARGGVPSVLARICQYRFVNNNPCRSRDEANSTGSGDEQDGDSDADGCLLFSCASCSEAAGRALREVGALLDSYYNALALYPSSKAMTADHPLVATQLFNNRLKALCLWYNMVLNLRSRLLGVRAHLRALTRARDKYARDRYKHASSVDSDVSGRLSDKPCRVRFNINGNPSDSNNSDSSSQSDPRPAPDSDSQPNEPSSPTVEATTPKVEASECTIEGTSETCQDKPIEALSQRDEVDNATIEYLADTCCGSAPEIVINSNYNNNNGTVDTTASSESGYASERNECEGDVYSMGSLDDLTALCLLGHCRVSPYRYYLSDILKTQGVRRSMMFIHKLRKHILQKVYLAFEKPDGDSGQCSGESRAGGVFDETEECDSGTDMCQQQAYELRRYGSWSAECQAMRLPSYRSHFLLLSTLSLEVVHDYLALRLSATPERPSCLTVKQMIHELKEGIDLATDMRAAYVRHLRAALRGYRAAPAARRQLRTALDTFDDTVRLVLKQYLSYLTTLSEGKFLSRSQLEAEWNFTSRLATRVQCVITLAPPAFTDIVCNQIDRLLSEFQSKFDDYFAREEENITDTDDVDARRQLMYALCREAQHFHTAARERTLHAVQAARTFACRLLRAPPPAYRELRERIFQHLMRARAGIVSANMLIIERGGHALGAADALGEGLSSRLREVLLQVFRLGFELHRELYRYAREPLRVTSSPRGGRPSSLQPPRIAPPPPRRRPETVIVNESVNPLLHKELHRFVSDSVRGGGRRPRLGREDSIVEDQEDRFFDDNFQQKQISIELLLSGVEGEAAPLAPLAPPPAQSGPPLEEQWAQQVGRAIIQFAECWMRFVTQRCDRGRGLRPRWASQGLEFLMLACDPNNTKHLTDSEFEELKQLMDECISHVIGSRAPEPAPRRPARPRAPLSPMPPMAAPSPPLIAPPTSHAPPTSPVPAPPTPPSPPPAPDPLAAFRCVDTVAHSHRVSAATLQLDRARDQKLRALQAVGRTLEAVTSYEPKLRQVTFKWQRGLKIGAGTFGKVYTVINTETSQLLAMKELAVCAGDRRSLQRAANELRVLEGVIHPHLVRYYGCELHREEMLIFMELCVEGSLEALLATAGALPEHSIRKYTKQLVSAVTELHARGIAHRDIKSGNIFLTNEGHCLKLGDFGCAVKIRTNSTAVGELQGTVGTQAYMAPEVFMKSSGHGRGADIWSLGCVVTEMASGKRPWSEYDSNYQIMFVVGMGGRPAVPDALSDEGRDFCRLCLTHEPDARPKATALAQHHFLMVKSDEDCNCQPGYLITK